VPRRPASAPLVRCATGLRPTPTPSASQARRSTRPLAPGSDRHVLRLVEVRLHLVVPLPPAKPVKKEHAC